jgi:hypothetical protein
LIAGLEMESIIIDYAFGLQERRREMIWGL